MSASSSGLLAASSCVVCLPCWWKEMPFRGTLIGLRCRPVQTSWSQTRPSGPLYKITSAKIFSQVHTQLYSHLMHSFRHLCRQALSVPQSEERWPDWSYILNWTFNFNQSVFFKHESLNGLCFFPQTFFLAKWLGRSSDVILITGPYETAQKRIELLDLWNLWIRSTDFP